MEPFTNGITPAQAERLALLLEELGEAQQEIGKILRHGFESRHPDHGHGGPTNRQALERESGHVLHALNRMWAAGDLSVTAVSGHAADKARSVWPYLHHQAGCPEPVELALDGLYEGQRHG